MAIITITEQNFDSVVAEHDLLVVDFWAPWCAPCQTFNAIVDKLDEELVDISFAKINIDEQPELAKEFDVQSVPAVMILRTQTVVFAQSGLLPADALRELIDQASKLDPAELKKGEG
jgi:thioredoxin 1